MSSAKLYVVMGSWSEYSDRRQWVAAVHLDQDNASQHLVAIRCALETWHSLDREEREALAGGDPYGVYRSDLDQVEGFYVQLEEQRYWMVEAPAAIDVPSIPMTLTVGGAR